MPLILKLTTKSELDAILQQKVPGDDLCDKLVILYFFVSWSYRCKKVYPRIIELQDLHPDVLFLRVDGDESRHLVQYHNVRKYPTFIFYKNDLRHGRLKGTNIKALENRIQQFYDEANYDSDYAGVRPGCCSCYGGL